MAIQVLPDIEHFTHHVSLTRTGAELGLILCTPQGKADGRISRRPYPSSATVKMYSGEQEYADTEPPFSPQVQKDWSSGRGSLFFDDDSTRYLDSWRVMTQLTGKVFLGGQETYTSGYRDCVQALPGSVTWQALYGADRYHSRQITGAALDGVDFDAFFIEGLVRAVGSPGALTAAVYSNSGGNPLTMLRSGSISITSSTDILSWLASFTLDAAADINQGTVYHIVFFGAATDDEANHWEIGLDASSLVGKKSADGSSWSGATGAPYFRLLDATPAFTALFDEYKGGMYFATRPDNGAAGKIYLNGYRGLADENGSDLNYLRDAEQAFAAWQPGWRVEIYDGAGATEPDNWRKVIGGTATQLQVSPPWVQAHTQYGVNATQYNVLGTDLWSKVADLSFPAMDIETTGEFLWVASGENKDSLIPRSVWRFQEYQDGTAWRRRAAGENLVQASYLKSIYDPVVGWELYLARNNDADADVTVSRQLAPTQWDDQLHVARPYYSTSLNGFMSELYDQLDDIASDSFNRANGALGSTDGAAAGGHGGGAGVAWQILTGSFAIESNRAKSSVLTSGRAVAVVDTQKVDVCVQANITRAADSPGIILRCSNVDNYIAIAHDGTNIAITKRIGGTDTAHASIATPYVDGAALRAEMAGTRLRVYYNGAKVGEDYSITEAELNAAACTKVGMAVLALNQYWDNFFAWSNAVQVSHQAQDTTLAIIEVAPGHGTGTIATDIILEQDWRRFSELAIDIRVSKALSAGELELLVSDTALCTNVLLQEGLPALAPGVFYSYMTSKSANVEFDLSTVEGADKVISVGLNLTVAPTTPFKIEVAFRWLLPEEKLIIVGDKSDKITGLAGHGDPEALWILKQGSLYEVANNLARKVQVYGLEAVASSDNGKAHVSQDAYLYFSLMDGFERYHKQNIDDLGPNLGEGMPADRRGKIVHAVNFATGIVAAYDGGVANTSSVLFYNERGWHEIYRAPRPGLRIRRVYIQDIPGSSTARLWVSQGSDVLWLPISMNLNPKEPGDYRFTHEGALTSSRLACKRQDLVKFWNSLKTISEQLGEACTVQAQYRTDANTSWTSLESEFNQSPSQERDLSPEMDVAGKWFQHRLIFRTTDNQLTPILLALVVEALVQEEMKFAFDLTFRLADRDIDLLGNEQASSLATQRALLDSWVASALPVKMRCYDAEYDDLWVKPQPASMRHWREHWETNGKKVSGEICQISLLQV